MRVYDEYVQLIEQSKEDVMGLIYIGKDIAGSPHLTTAEKWELQLIIRSYRGI